MGAWGVNIGSYRRRIIIFLRAGPGAWSVKHTPPPNKKNIDYLLCDTPTIVACAPFCLFPHFSHFAFILHFFGSIFLSNFPFLSLSFKFPSFFSSPFCIFPQATSADVLPLGKYMHSSRGAWKLVFRTLGHRRKIYIYTSFLMNKIFTYFLENSYQTDLTSWQLTPVTARSVPLS